MKKRTICVVTGTRAEYGLLFPIMKKIQSSASLELQIVATTMHLSEEFGCTYRQIEADGFCIDEKVENLLSVDSKSAVAKSTGLAMVLLSDVFSRLNPDVVVVLGDRFETLAVTSAAMLMNIPIAHVHGGEITLGAVDEKIRHSITKMSNIHFTSTEQYRQRVIQMGERADSVFFVGAPGIDNIVNTRLLSRTELEAQLGWNINGPTALFTYHPETLSSGNYKETITKILDAIGMMELNVLFTFANSDDGGRIINREIKKFAARNKTKYLAVDSLGQLKYLSAMKELDIIIGNTSSGIIEAASFSKPVVNVGTRQDGRIKNENVLDCSIDNLNQTIERSLSKEFADKLRSIKNLYGDGQASARIVKKLESQPLTVVKKFRDAKC